jgi:SAM-dependent methyltransferase
MQMVDASPPSLDYESRRFGRTPRGRRMNRFKRCTVERVISRLPADRLILDVPCGLGRFKDIVLQHGHRYLGIDLDFSAAHRAAERVSGNFPALQGSILALPLLPDSADFILSVRMFHHFHFEEVGQALKELSRVAPQSPVTFYNRHTWRIQRRRFSLRIRRRTRRGGEAWDEKSYSVHEMADLARMAGLRIREKIPTLGPFTGNQFLWLERL